LSFVIGTTPVSISVRVKPIHEFVNYLRNSHVFSPLSAYGVQSNANKRLVCNINAGAAGATIHCSLRGCVPNEPCYTVVTVSSNYKGGVIYVRKVMSRGRGPYFQLVRSYRNEDGQPRLEVLIHLGTHERPEDALEAWPSEVEHLRAIGREEQAEKLEANLQKLRALTEAETGRE
jgi:hypothetical protein